MPDAHATDRTSSPNAHALSEIPDELLEELARAEMEEDDMPLLGNCTD